MSGIILKNISKSFGDKTLFSGVSHVFAEGSVTCIMGESGRGKTTLLNIILGLVVPDSGDIQGAQRPISAVFQEDRLCEPFSAVGNILAVTGKTVARDEILSCLRDFGLSGSEDLPVSALSGGMRRRVAIARALLAKSEVVLLDEPFKGLDDALREAVISVILSRTKGKTLIIATHDMRDCQLLGAEIMNL